MANPHRAIKIGVCGTKQVKESSPRPPHFPQPPEKSVDIENGHAEFFERRWGGSFLSMGRENNAVILTRRGTPLKEGIVYDAWRGTGRPFWRPVSEDKKYRWSERFSETEILMGDATVEPK